jgi:hypothetical protein
MGPRDQGRGDGGATEQLSSWRLDYNASHIWLLLQAPSSAPTKSNR